MGYTGMNLRRILGVFAVTCLLSTAFSADKDLSLSYRPLFLSVVQPQLFAPYLIQIENKGPNTKGVFTISAGLSRTRYPIDLPQNTTKEITVYMPSTYEAVRGRLTTDIGNAELKFPETGSASNCLLSIGDTDGILNFTKSVDARNAMGSAFNPMSAKPKDLPDRTASYLSFAAVFLADGAEKVSEKSRLALERYVMVGGTLVVSGGASAPLINDPTWRHMLPVYNVRPETQQVDGSDVVSGLRIENDFTMSVGTLAPEAIVKAKYRDKPFIVSKPYGFGRVVFVAANLFENPVSKWEGKNELLINLNLNDSAMRMASLQAMSMTDPTQNPMRYSPGMPPTYGGIEDTGPFSASVPPTSTVVWILIAYFILVVPMNLLLLKKKGRGELAWITSPILSLGFAAVFFRFAAGLYTADLSTASTGFLVADQRTNQAYFLGGSQMFFPRGGRYDLQLEGVEGIRNRESDPYGMYGGRGMMRQDSSSDFDPVDVGSQLQVPDLSVSNLSFKEFGYFQAAKGDWLAVTPSGTNAVSVTNRSGYALKDGNLYYKGGIADVGEIKAGQTKIVRIEQTGAPRREFYNEMGMGLDQMISNQTQGSRIAITGTLSGYRPGPKIGNLVERNTRLQLIWFGTRARS